MCHLGCVKCVSVKCRDRTYYGLLPVSQSHSHINMTAINIVNTTKKPTTKLGLIINITSYKKQKNPKIKTHAKLTITGLTYML